VGHADRGDLRVEPVDRPTGAFPFGDQGRVLLGGGDVEGKTWFAKRPNSSSAADCSRSRRWPSARRRIPYPISATVIAVV